MEPKRRQRTATSDPFQWSMVSFPTAQASREEIATTAFNPVKRHTGSRLRARLPGPSPLRFREALTHPAEARGAAVSPAAAARLEACRPVHAPASNRAPAARRRDKRDRMLRLRAFIVVDDPRCAAERTSMCSILLSSYVFLMFLTGRRPTVSCGSLPGLLYPV